MPIAFARIANDECPLIPDFKKVVLSAGIFFLIVSEAINSHLLTCRRP